LVSPHPSNAPAQKALIAAEKSDTRSKAISRSVWVSWPQAMRVNQLPWGKRQKALEQQVGSLERLVSKQHQTITAQQQTIQGYRQTIASQDQTINQWC
jgi:hypothetical protein